MPLRRLHFSPRATRFFVLALVLLQFVAPTWHICALGGHVSAHNATAHHGAAPVVKGAPNAPLICFCAPHVKPLDPRTPRLDGLVSLDHRTCLALLLQTLPAQVAAPVALFDERDLISARFDSPAFQQTHRAAPRRFRGRAPPWKC